MSLLKKSDWLYQMVSDTFFGICTCIDAGIPVGDCEQKTKI